MSQSVLTYDVKTVQKQPNWFYNLRVESLFAAKSVVFLS